MVGNYEQLPRRDSLNALTVLNEIWRRDFSAARKSFQFPTDNATGAIYVTSIENKESHIDALLNHLPIGNAVRLGRESGIVVTHSTPIQGTLISGTVAFRNPQIDQFERLAQIFLERELSESDRGSPVADESTGHL
ncbi:hypothetical protein RRF57_007226 [Xylaria bambusicola]|uniref:Uncharacterized protein n=1 Tax=Xylaria bambusicola TaxID=326684 RepID=A0AAN7UMF2_9PEZI